MKSALVRGPSTAAEGTEACGYLVRCRGMNAARPCQQLRRYFFTGAPRNFTRSQEASRLTVSILGRSRCRSPDHDDTFALLSSLAPPDVRAVSCDDTGRT